MQGCRYTDILFASRNPSYPPVHNKHTTQFCPSSPLIPNFNPLPNPLARAKLLQAGKTPVHDPTKDLDTRWEMSEDIVEVLMDIQWDILIHIENQDADVVHLETPTIDTIGNTRGCA